MMAGKVDQVFVGGSLGYYMGGCQNYGPFLVPKIIRTY